MRKKIIAGNWKMNKNPEETESFISEFKDFVKDTEHEVVLCVPFVDLCKARKLTRETNIKVGAQNMHFAEEGAFTGEISGKIAKDVLDDMLISGKTASEIINEKGLKFFYHNHHFEEFEHNLNFVLYQGHVYKKLHYYKHHIPEIYQYHQ